MKEEMRAWIELVLARALDLRRAGVLSIGPGAAVFAPYVEPPEAADSTTDATSSSSSSTSAAQLAAESPPAAIDDPASYADGIVPGWPVNDLED